MAIIKTGIVVAGIRGTIGGITFSQGAQGPTARLWSKGSNPRSTAQQITRGRLATHGALWNSMTDALRADWRSFAASPPESDYNSLGEQIWLSGWQWFTRIQQRLESVGAARDTTVPSDVAATPPASVTLTASELPAGSVDVGWPSATFGATDSAILYLAAHTTTGMLVKEFGRLLCLALTDPGDTGEDITSTVSTRFGDIRAGWRLYGSLYLQRADGVRSVPATTSTEVT